MTDLIVGSVLRTQIKRQFFNLFNQIIQHPFAQNSLELL